MATYDAPSFLSRPAEIAAYRRWLQRKAVALVRRDRQRGNSRAVVAEYKRAIHAAVRSGGERDFYTGQRLDWSLISRYDNDASAKGGRAYKKRFGGLPTVDHLGDGRGKPRFVICSWRTNDAKHDLDYAEFVELCRLVVARERTHGSAIRRRRA